jgi:hypothetical protein
MGGFFCHGSPMGRQLCAAGENVDTEPFPKMQKVNEDPVFT